MQSLVYHSPGPLLSEPVDDPALGAMTAMIICFAKSPSSSGLG